MKPGMVADITVLADERGKMVLRDNSGDEVVTDRARWPDFVSAPANASTRMRDNGHPRSSGLTRL